MTTRTKTTTTEAHDEWVALHPTQHQRLSAGDAVRVRGARGTWTFVHANYRADYSLDSLTVIGGSGGHRAFRSFAPERIIRKRQARA